MSEPLLADGLPARFKELERRLAELERPSPRGLGTPTGSVLAFAGSTAPLGFLLCDGTAVSRTTFGSLFAVVGTTYGAGDGTTTFNLPDLRGRVVAGRDAAQAEFDVLGEAGGAKTHTLTITEMPAHAHTVNSHSHGSTGTTSTDHAHNVYGRDQNTGGQSDNHSHQGRTAGFGGDFSAGAQGYPAYDAHWGFRTTDRSGQLLYAGTIGGVCRIDNNSVYQDHSHNFNHDHPSTNYQSQAPWAGNWQHSHSIPAESPATNAQGSGAAHNNLPPYRVLNHIIRT